MDQNFSKKTEQTMPEQVSRLADPDMQGVYPALLRAAARAREVAQRTGTNLVVRRDDVLVEVDPFTLEVVRRIG
jgi:hypothetical protein